MGLQSIYQHGVKGVVVEEYKYLELNDDPAKGYTRMKLILRLEDGSHVELILFGGEDGIDFKAPGLEQRACAECGNLMPREYHPRVTVCAACETSPAASEGPQVESAR